MPDRLMNKLGDVNSIVAREQMLNDFNSKTLTVSKARDRYSRPNSIVTSADGIRLQASLERKKRNCRTCDEQIIALQNAVCKDCYEIHCRAEIAKFKQNVKVIPIVGKVLFNLVEGEIEFEQLFSHLVKATLIALDIVDVNGKLTEYGKEIYNHWEETDQFNSGKCLSTPAELINKLVYRKDIPYV